MISPGISDHFKLHKQYLMSELLKFAVLIRCIMHLYIINIQVLCTSSLSKMLKIFFLGGGGRGEGGCLHIIPGLVIAML